MFDKMKQIAVTTCLLIALGLLNQPTASAQSCTPAPVGLVSWWQGEANALDSRSRSNGTLVGNTNFVPGQVGQAFNFDGVDDSVQIPHDPNQNIQGSFSAEAWVFPRSSPNIAPRILVKEEGGGGFWGMETGDGVNSNLLHVNINNAVLISTGPNSVPLNQWSHVAFTYNGATGEIKLFVNGAVLNSTTVSVQTTSNTGSLRIGNEATNVRDFDGLIDEAQIYSRALSDSEILATANAGQAGNCKPTATTTPTNLISWWPGDGNFNDIQGSNSPSQINGSPQFDVGRVSQGTKFDGLSGLVVADNPTLNFGTGSFSAEMWTRIDSFPGANGAVLFEKRNNVAQGYILSMDSTGFFFTVRGNGGAATVQASPVSTGGLHHLAITVDRATNRATFYLNGIPQPDASIASIGNTDNTASLFIGQNSTQSGTTAGAFTGVIDEFSLYNKTLTQDEITSIFNAGLAGKLKTAATPIGTNVSTNVGSDATITFSNVSSSGTTQQIPLGLVGLPALPPGFTSTGLAYDIATSASISGNTSVCFNLPALDNVTFAKSRIFHQEGGVWVNRTTSATARTLCSSVSSLSPFLIAQDPSLPTAAAATISGTVTAADGAPVAGVVMKLSGQRSVTTITNAAGNYHFDNVETDNFYTVTPSLVNYSFAPASRSFSLLGNKTDAVFTANPELSVSANPMDTAEFFVRQQYLDVLGREPDQGGFEYWSEEINRCNGDALCIRAQRISVAAAFFIEREAQQTGSFIYDTYAGTLSRQPRFAEYSVDHQQVIGGVNLEAQKTAFAQGFVQRPEFITKYQGAIMAESFVDALLQNVQSSGVDLGGERVTLIGAYNHGADLATSRAAVVSLLADNTTFKQSQYNRAFVLTEYFAYLQRDAEPEGYTFWVNVLNAGDPGNYRGMVCSFITSAEYQRRFSPIVTHSNSECSGQ